MTKRKDAPTTSPTPRLSPLVPTKETFSFPTAMQKVIEGKSVTKEEWGNPAIKVSLMEGILRIYLDDNLWHDLKVSEGDMVGLDWMEVKNG